MHGGTIRTLQTQLVPFVMVSVMKIEKTYPEAFGDLSNSFTQLMEDMADPVKMEERMRSIR